MNWKHYLGAFLLGLGIFSIYSVFQQVPGYMDAEYYYGMGLRIAKHHTLTEPFLWNFIYPHFEIPHPGFTYWMPMPAFVAAAGMTATGWMTFQGAKIGSILIAAFVPVITMRIAFDLTQKKFYSYLAGALSLFPVYYSSFITTTDSFSILMVLGGLVILAVNKKNALVSGLLIGLLVGLIHLTRAEGLIWLGAAIFVVFIKSDQRLSSVIFLLLGYLLVMAPWFSRNYLNLGEIMPSGSTKMLWLTEYNDLFKYEAGSLTFKNWTQQGLPGIAKNISNALVFNLKTAVFIQGQIILAPLVVVGFYRHRQEKSVFFGFIAYFAVLILMTFIFPFAGRRGAFFHSGAAFQPLLWSLGSSGFQLLMEYGVRKRSWEISKANMLFGVSLVVLLATANGLVYWDRVIGDNIKDPIWSQSFDDAVQIGGILLEMGVSENDLVMVNNPPGLYIAAGYSSIVIPNGGMDALIQAGKDFQADYLILEGNHPEDLNDLYNNPELEQRLDYKRSFDGVHYFKLR